MMTQERYLVLIMKNNIVSNYHTHTYLCKHAEGTPVDYVKLAKNNNYHTIAITDHGPLIDEIYNQIYTRRMTYDQYYNIYLDLLKDAKKEEDIKVLSGIEIEYFSLMEKNYKEFLKDLDILILGEHYFPHKNKIFSVYDVKDPSDIEAYTNNLIQGIESGYFSLVAHPDIFFWNYKTWDEHCINASRKIIECAIKNDIPLEINANGIRNSTRKNHFSYTSDNHISYDYPKYEFWKLVKEYNAKVVINDDVHFFKEFCDEATIKAYELAHELNLNVIDQIIPKKR